MILYKVLSHILCGVNVASLDSELEYPYFRVSEVQAVKPPPPFQKSLRYSKLKKGALQIGICMVFELNVQCFITTSKK